MSDRLLSADNADALISCSASITASLPLKRCDWQRRHQTPWLCPDHPMWSWLAGLDNSA